MARINGITYRGDYLVGEQGPEYLVTDASTTTVKSVVVGVETYSIHAPAELGVDAVSEALRDQVEQRQLVVVGEVEVTHVEDPITRSGTFVARVRVLADPPAEVREHFRGRVYRVEPNVTHIAVPVVSLGGRPSPVVDARRPIRETRTAPHSEHATPDPNCESCQQAIFDETRRRAADYARRGVR